MAFILRIVFILGFVLDWMDFVLIIAPLTIPVVLSFGFDPIWVAILFVICLPTSFLTPSVEMALFYVKNGAPADVTTVQIYRGVVPFVVLQLLGLLLVWSFSPISLWLPTVAY